MSDTIHDLARRTAARHIAGYRSPDEYVGIVIAGGPDLDRLRATMLHLAHVVATLPPEPADTRALSSGWTWTNQAGVHDVAVIGPHGDTRDPQALLEAAAVLIGRALAALNQQGDHR